jgi:phosphatidate cytidylyltransferase
MAMSSLAQRVVTAALLVPVVLAALFLLPPRGWGLVSLVIIAAAAHEWTKLVGLRSLQAATLIVAVVVMGLVLLFAPAFGFDRGWPTAVVVVACGAAAAFWLFVAPAWLNAQWRTQRPFAMAIVGAVVLVGAWVAIVDLQAHSPWLVLAAMAVVWLADTAAYFAGRRFGRRKLAPSISPNKSWEGVWGGMLAVALYALALTSLGGRAGYAGEWRLSLAIAFVAFVVVLAAISIVGDLYESMLKRQAGVKDSGTLLPGHGGVLDRIDALLPAMPLAALAATLFLPDAA